jgi:hypothetical protein
MTTTERASKSAEKLRARPANPSAQIVQFPASMRPTGGAGRLPTAVITRRGLDPEQIFHVAYRSLHIDGAGWGCHPRKMAAAVRSGYSRSVFQKTQRSLIEKGLIKREQGKRKRPGRGRGYAVDTLTFENPEAAYVVIDRSLFDGSRTPKEIACFLHLKARGRRLAEPWQIEQLMQASRPTINAVLAALSDVGLVDNYGTAQAPQWGVSGCKNPTFKKTARKKSSFKRASHTHPLGSSRQSVPHTSVSQHKNDCSRTDCDAAAIADRTADLLAGTVRGLAGGCGAGETSKGPMPLDSEGEPVRLSNDDRATIEALGGDVEELFDRAMAQKAKGRRIGSVVRYMIQSAKNDAKSKLGCELGVVTAIASGNVWARQAAYAEALSKGPAKSLDGKTPNGTALLAALKR